MSIHSETRAIPPGLGNGRAAAIRHAWTLLDQVGSAFGKNHPATEFVGRTVATIYHHAEGELLREQEAAARPTEESIR